MRSLIKSRLVLKDGGSFIRILAFISTIVCVEALYDTGEPRALYLAILNGICISIALNLGLWLVSIKKLRVKFKWVFVVWILLSLIGITFTMMSYGIFAGMASLLFHIWLLIYVIRGKNNEMATYC